MQDDPGNIVPKEFTYRPFSESFSDLVILLKLHVNSNSEDETALGKAVRSASFELLEAIANSLLKTIPNFSREIKKRLDRLSVFEKFDFLCSTRTNKPLEASVFASINSHVEPRNKKTHPKPLSSLFKNIRQGEDGRILFETKQTPPKISRESVCLFVLEVMKFLDLFLLDICKCDHDYLKKLLLDFAILSNGTTLIFQKEKLFSRKNTLRKLLGKDTRFLSFISDLKLSG